MIYYETLSTLEEALRLAKASNKKLVYSAPRIIRNKEYKRLEKVKNLNQEDIQIGTLGSIRYFENKKSCRLLLKCF